MLCGQFASESEFSFQPSVFQPSALVFFKRSRDIALVTALGSSSVGEMIRRLAHLCLRTNDLPRQIEFYENALGLPIKFRFINSEGQLYGAYFECGDSTFIEIFDDVLAIKQWGGEVKPLKGGQHFNHLCLECVGMEETRAMLLKRGVKLGEISVGLDHSKQMWTEDPDGNKIELMEYTHRSRQLQPRS